VSASIAVLVGVNLGFWLGVACMAIMGRAKAEVPPRQLAPAAAIVAGAYLAALFVWGSG